MATKTEITAAINLALADASNITAAEHRSVLHTDADSILESIYPTPVTDVSSGTKTITTSNANFTYTVTFTKTGRKINVNGSFINASGGTLNPLTKIFDLTLAEYQTGVDTFAMARKSGISQGDVLDVYMSSTNEFRIAETVLNLEKFKFNFNYNAQN